jgi:hypothetical protein
MEELRFFGAIRQAFEELTGALLAESESSQSNGLSGINVAAGSPGPAKKWMSNVYQDYVAAGSPGPAKKWIRHALAKLVLSADGMPVWIESIKPRWPWYDGRPMIYLGQAKVPDTQVSKEHASPGVSLFVFGLRVAVEGGWSMKYTVVEQHPDL